MSLDDFKILIKEKLDASYNVSDSYKTSDYRPAFGIIFEKIVKKYKYWGYCDMDVILGDIDSYFYKILGNYDKYFSNGHLTFFKNDYENNRRFLLKCKNHEYVNFADVANISFTCNQDEAYGISRLWDYYHFSVFNDVLFEDIDIYEFAFKTTYCKYNNYRKIYHYKNNKLYVVYANDGIIHEDEILYIHLQKRIMEVPEDIYNNFLIIPNKIEEFVGDIRYFLNKNTKQCFTYKLKMKLKYKYNIKKFFSDYKNGKYIFKKLKKEMK